MLKLKCFAYLPCNENESADTQYENIISNALERQTGTCENGAQVIVFDSIDDYSYYLKTVLNKNQILKVKISYRKLLFQSEFFFFSSIIILFSWENYR